MLAGPRSRDIRICSEWIPFPHTALSSQMAHLVAVVIDLFFNTGKRMDFNYKHYTVLPLEHRNTQAGNEI